MKNRNIVLLALVLVLFAALSAPMMAESNPWRRELFAVRSVPLVEGFNLIGWTGDEVLVEDALASIAGKFDLVYGYDAFDSDPWRTWQADPAFAEWNTLLVMRRGMGYWVRCTEPCVLELP